MYKLSMSSGLILDNLSSTVLFDILVILVWCIGRALGVNTCRVQWPYLWGAVFWNIVGIKIT